MKGSAARTMAVERRFYRQLLSLRGSARPVTQHVGAALFGA